MKNSAVPAIAKLFAAAWTVFSLLATVWALATPIGAAPDEPAHLIKAASVVRGEFIGHRVAGGNVVRVPEYVAFSFDQTCYAFKSNITADCMKQVPGDPNRLVDARTSAGLYNPAYYALVGWPSLIFADSSGIFAMRILSGIIVSLFLAIAVALISTWDRAIIPMVGLAIAITPMAVFLAGTVNPNALEVSAILAAFVGISTFVRQPNSSAKPLHIAVLFVSASVAANMRGLSLLWLAFALSAPLLVLKRTELLSLWRHRGTPIASVGIGVAAVAAAVWLISTNSLGTATSSSGALPPVPGTGSSPLRGFVLTLLSTFEYAKEIVGVFGWLDTQAPDFVYFCWALLGGGLLFVCGLLLRGRASVPTLALGGAVVMLPPILQGYYIHSGGIIWQGRYILPLFACLIVAAASALSKVVRFDQQLSLRISIAIFGLWGISQFFSFAVALRRYSVGADAGWVAMLHPRWTPPLGIAVLLCSSAVILTLGVGSLIRWLRAHSFPHQLERIEPLNIGAP